MANSEFNNLPYFSEFKIAKVNLISLTHLAGVVTCRNGFRGARSEVVAQLKSIESLIMISPSILQISNSINKLSWNRFEELMMIEFVTQKSNAKIEH